MTAGTDQEITERWAGVRASVAAACERAGRAPSEVTIVAVAKTHPASAIREAAAAGATDFGENYAQELADKQAELGRSEGAPLRWHFIGRLQRNKAKLVAGKVALVHAVDSEELAAELAKRAAQLPLRGTLGLGSGVSSLRSDTPAIDGPRVQPILVAVNLAGETTKGGVTAEAAPALARRIAALANVRLDGLMTMPPPSEDPAASRPMFEALRELRDRIAGELGRPLPILSMGMSGDYEVAIACGATHVRIGTAIFGSRPVMLEA